MRNLRITDSAVACILLTLGIILGFGCIWDYHFIYLRGWIGAGFVLIPGLLASAIAIKRRGRRADALSGILGAMLVGTSILVSSIFYVLVRWYSP